MNLTRAEVHGTLSFYHDFRTSLPARRTIKLCQAEACQARGSAALTAHAETRLGTHIDPHGHASARGVSLEPIYCLGLCSSGPSALIDGRPHARLSNERFDALTKELA